MKPSVLMLATVVCVVLLAPVGAVGLDAPVKVTGNEEMAALPGITGTGTEIDPFVIEGMHFEGGAGSPLLALCDVTAHTIVKDCTFVGAEDVALDLQACGNVWILSCVFSDNALAVSVSAECTDIVIALNTFERNGEDVDGDAGSVRLDDGYVGNWWDGNATFDMSGDGLSEIPYFVCAGEHPLLDMHSLVFPYAGDAADDEEGVRLEVRFSPGDTYRLVSRAETDMIMHTSELSTRTTLTQNVEYVLQVASAPGTGYAEILLEVVDDSGSLFLNDEPFDYDSVQGTSWTLDSHRFGGGGMSMTAAGTNPDNAAVLGPIQASYTFYPVRAIAVGHTWTDVLDPEPTQSGSVWSTTTAEVSCVFSRLDALRGDACAVIKSHSTAILGGQVMNEATQADVDMSGTIDTEIMLWVSLATGQTLRTVLSSEGAIESRMDGEPYMTVEYSMHIETDLYDDV